MATGSIKAYEHERVTGNSKYRGWIRKDTAKFFRTGSKILQQATFEVTSVALAVAIQTTNTNRKKEKKRVGVQINDRIQKASKYQHIGGDITFYLYYIAKTKKRGLISKYTFVDYQISISLTQKKSFSSSNGSDVCRSQ